MNYYQYGSVSVQPTATLICVVSSENNGVLIQNAGTAAVFLGDPNVATSGSSRGLSVAPGLTITVPSVGGTTTAIYGITEAVPQTVTYLMP